MLPEPILTVVIPVFNREKILMRTLESVRCQTVRPLSVIIVDNNSSDSSYKVAYDWAMENSSEDFEVRVFNEISPGACAARNRGLIEVDTPLVSFLDSDDEVAPEYAGEIIRAFYSSDNTDIVTWPKRIRRGDRQRILPFHTHDMLKAQVIHATLSTSTFAVKTSFLREIGGWDNDLPCWQDWELGIRILANNPNLIFLHQPIAVVNPTDNSITGSDFSHRCGEWEKAAEKAMTLIRRDGLNRLPGLIRYKLCCLAGFYAREGNKLEGRKLLAKVLKEETCLLRRIRLRMLYNYIAFGLPGGPTLFSLFL